jgi:membrane protein required for colicin V production
LLLVSLLLFALVSLAVSQLVRKAGLSSIDRTVGAFFGFLRGVVVLVLLVLVAGLTPLPRDPAWRNATFSPPLEALAIYARGFLPEAFAARIHYE